MTIGTLRDRAPGHEVELHTPEGLVLKLPCASDGDRLAAFAIDAAMIVFPLSFAEILARFLFGETVGSVLLGLGLFLGRNFYFLYFEINCRGVTPGKRRMRLRVVERSGGRLRASSLVARNLLRELEVFLPIQAALYPEALWPGAPAYASALASIWLFALAILPLFSHERRRLGDLIAGTIVIREPEYPLLPDLGGSGVHGAPVESPCHFSERQLSVYGIRELQVLEGVLRRARREELGTVFEQIVRKIDWTGDRSQLVPQVFLQAYYIATRAHLEGRLLVGRRREDKHSDVH